MVSSVRMHATRATLGALPATRTRRDAARITGFHFVAARVAMASAARTAARPPQIVWRPRRVPLSRVSGAPPTRAASCLRFRRPRSGNSASRGAAEPGAEAQASGQAVLLCPPEGTLPDRLIQIADHPFPCWGQPGDGGGTPLLDTRGGRVESVPLRGEPLAPLAPPGQQRAQLRGLRLQWHGLEKGSVV